MVFQLNLQKINKKEPNKVPNKTTKNLIHKQDKVMLLRENAITL